MMPTSGCMFILRGIFTIGGTTGLPSKFRTTRQATLRMAVFWNAQR